MRRAAKEVTLSFLCDVNISHRKLLYSKDARTGNTTAKQFQIVL